MIAGSRRLLRAARELGSLEEAHVFHRWGRALHDIGRATRQGRLLIAAQETLANQRYRAGERDNPFFRSLAAYYLAKDLHDDAAVEQQWDECRQMVLGYGEGVHAHWLYGEAMRLQQEGKLLEVTESLGVAFDIWKRLPYRRGALEALVQLGLVHAKMDLGIQAAANATICFASAEDIAAQHFPAYRGSITQYREACAARCGWDAGRIEEAVAELHSTAPLLFNRLGLELSLPGSSLDAFPVGFRRAWPRHSTKIVPILGRPD